MGEWLKASLYSRTGFPDLLTPEKAAHITLIPEERLIELAKSGHAPCAFLGEDQIFFFKKDICEWVKENLFRIQNGKRVETEIRIIADGPAPFGEIPTRLAPLAEKLKQFHGGSKFSCIYFLIHKSEVVYVGQSVALGGRIEQHRNDKEFDQVFYFQFPEYGLLNLETAFIRHLKPKYNRAQASSEMDRFDEEQLEAIKLVPPNMEAIEKKRQALEGLLRSSK